METISAFMQNVALKKQQQKKLVKVSFKMLGGKGLNTAFVIMVTWISGQITLHKVWDNGNDRVGRVCVMTL